MQLSCVAGQLGAAFLYSEQLPKFSNQGQRPRPQLSRSASVSAMRVTTHIDCTPAEARAFLGLPDLEPLQAAVMDQLQRRMVGEIDRFTPEALVEQWLSVVPQNVGRMQEAFANMFLAGLGQGRN